jgi:hypothetical protein
MCRQYCGIVLPELFSNALAMNTSQVSWTLHLHTCPRATTGKASLHKTIC